MGRVDTSSAIPGLAVGIAPIDAVVVLADLREMRAAHVKKSGAQPA